MPQEPKSFFERITGTRLLSDDDQGGATAPVAYEEEQEVEQEVAVPAADEVQDAIAEPEVEAEEVFSDEATGETEEEQEGQLTVDVFQDDQNIIIQSTIAGVSPEDLDVSITNDMVTVRGERRRQFDVDHEDYFYQECYWGTFSRSIILPVEIDADRAEAKIKNGVMTIRIPKANQAVTRKLKVKSS